MAHKIGKYSPLWILMSERKTSNFGWRQKFRSKAKRWRVFLSLIRMQHNSGHIFQSCVPSLVATTSQISSARFRYGSKFVTLALTEEREHRWGIHASADGCLCGT